MLFLILGIIDLLFAADLVTDKDALSNFLDRQMKQYYSSNSVNPIILPSAVFVSSPVVLKNSKHSLIGEQDTIIDSSLIKNSESLFRLSNVSFVLQGVSLKTSKNAFLLNIEKHSDVDFNSIYLSMEYSEKPLFYVDDSSLFFKHLSLVNILKDVAPLTKCAGSGEIIGIHSSSVNSLITRGSDCLFGNSNAAKVIAKNNRFSNITMSNSFKVVNAAAPHQTCISLSNTFTSCDESYDGNILPGLFSKKFIATNNSHNDERKIHRERVTVTDVMGTFTSEDFIHCRAESENGGGISIRCLCILTVIDCAFNSCTTIGLSTTGGGISFYGFEGGMLTLANSSFDSCESELFGGGISIDGSATIDNCTFHSCQSEFGGGMSLNGITDNTTLSNLKFKECSTGMNGKGGGIYVYRVTKVGVSFINTSFIKCSSTANGGAMYFSSFETQEQSYKLNISFINVTFEDSECSSNDRKIGMDIGIEDGWWQVINKESFNNCKTNSPHPQILIRLVPGGDEYEIHNDWMKDNSPTPAWEIAVIIVSVVLFVIIVGAVVLCYIFSLFCFRRRKGRRMRGGRSAKEEGYKKMTYSNSSVSSVGNGKDTGVMNNSSSDVQMSSASPVYQASLESAQRINSTDTPASMISMRTMTSSTPASVVM